MDLFWNLHHDKRISEVGSRERGTASKTEQDRMKINELEIKINHMTLICMALWSFIKENHSATDKELIQRITEIDLLDGKLDGALQTKAKKCPKCGNVMNKKHNQCLYCGGIQLDHIDYNRP